MSYSVLTIPAFDKQLKRLVKKFPSMKDEFAHLIDTLSINPFIGAPLGKNCFKIRLAVKSKGKGKSGSARIISHVQVTKSNVFLLTIYDKNEHGSMSDHDINYLLSFINS